MSLAAALAAILEVVVPPGGTAYSVEPAPTGKFSSFYGATVVRETPHTARARYLDNTKALVAEVDFVLKESGSKLFTRTELAALALGVDQGNRTTLAAKAVGRATKPVRCRSTP